MLAQDSVTVVHQHGIHAQAATAFIYKANSFKSDIWVEKEGHRVNAKSLLGVISLGILQGCSIKLIAEGSDAEIAVRELKTFVESGIDKI